MVEYVLNPAFVGGSEFSGPHDSVVMGEKSLDGGPNGAALAGNRLPGTEGKSRIEDILGFMFPPRKLVTEGQEAWETISCKEPLKDSIELMAKSLETKLRERKAR